MMSEKSGIAINNCYWVLPGIFLAGEHPASKEKENVRLKIRWLLNKGVNFCLDLTERSELGEFPYEEAWKEEARNLGRKFKYMRISIPDFSIPSKQKMKFILDQLELALNEGNIVYLHCFGGLGRTGTVVGCYLSRKGFKGGEALKELSRLRLNSSASEHKSPETSQQIDFVIEWDEP